MSIHSIHSEPLAAELKPSPTTAVIPALELEHTVVIMSVAFKQSLKLNNLNILLLVLVLIAILPGVIEAFQLWH